MLKKSEKYLSKGKSILIWCVLIYTGVAQAVPTLYPDNWDSNIKNNTNSSLLADSAHYNRYYVLPPHTAEAKVRSLSQATTNIGFCKELAAIQKYNLDALEIIKSLQDRKMQLDVEYKNTEAVLKSAQIEMAQFVTANNLLELDAIDRQIQSLDRKLNDLYLHSKTCTKTCDLILEDIKQSQHNRNYLLNMRFDLSSSHVLQATEYEKRKQKINFLETDRDRSADTLRRLQTEIREMYTDYLSLYDAHAKREGAKIGLEYSSVWTSNVNRLSFDNPHRAFEKVPTKNATIKADAHSKSNLLAGSSILAFEISGQAASSVLSMGAFPESFSGNATINLLSACPLFFPQLFGFAANDPAVQPQNVKFGLIVSYEYPSLFKYSVETNYNLSRMYEVIKTQGKKGGLFSSKSWSDTQEREAFKDSFEVSWSSQDTNLVTDEQKAGIETDLRRQAMARLSNYVLMSKNTIPKVDSPPDLPNTGAMILSNSLSKNCSFVFSCKAASIGLDFLSAVFGSSEMSENLKQELNVNIKDRYSNGQVLMQTRVTSYQ
jgi:hypothetical protein